MKRFSIFLVALFAAATSFATVTYELNGGVTNEYGWQSKKDMYEALNADYNASSNSTKTWASYETQLGVGKSNSGIPTSVGSAERADLLAMFSKEDYVEKWGWLATYLDAVAATQYKKMDAANGVKTKPTTSANAFTFSLGNFFGEDKNHTTDYIDAVDFTGTAAQIVAFQPTWKHGFDNPTEPTDSFELNAPYLEGEAFRGWFDNPAGAGTPITHVDSTTTGTLYACYGEYIPNIKEVRALEEGATTKVAGIINHIGGNTIYIEDVSGFGMDIYVKEKPELKDGLKVGQNVVMAGTFTKANGWPRLIGTELVSATEAELLPVTKITSLAALVNDTVFTYYAKRVAINGLKVSKYDNYGNAFFTDGTYEVQGYYMELDQTIFPVGTKVAINGAIAAWYKGFQFTGDIASVTVGKSAGKDKYDYPARGENGEYTLTNEWVISHQEGTYDDNAPGQTLFVRGMAASNGKMYFINREKSNLVVVDGSTGEMLEPITIKGDHLFQIQDTATGNWASAVTLPFNDIKTDNAGNLLIGACLTNAQTFFVYKVNPETGEATEVIKEKVQDFIKDSQGNPITYRFDAFGVYGDVDGNACIMAADANSLNTYRWIIKDGKPGHVEQIAFMPDPAYDKSLMLKEDGNLTQSSFSTAPQIFPQDENGELFYVDGKDLLPMLVDEEGVLAQDFISVQANVGLRVVDNAGDTATIDGGLNGLCEFKVGDDYFFLFGATNFNKTPSSTFALYKFADEAREFSAMEPLWYFPQNGLGIESRAGELKNGCFAAVPSVEVEGNVAKIYLYSVDLGYGVYTLTCPEGTGVYDVEAETINAHKLLENGQVFIIKNGVKYNVLGVTVK